jgi:hypothetical protein
MAPEKRKLSHITLRFREGSQYQKRGSLPQNISISRRFGTVIMKSASWVSQAALTQAQLSFPVVQVVFRCVTLSYPEQPWPSRHTPIHTF